MDARPFVLEGMALLTGYFSWRGHHTGKVWTHMGAVSRGDQPALFWLAIVTWTAIAAVNLFLAVATATGGMPLG